MSTAPPSAAGIDNPRLEARLLLAHALGHPGRDALLRDPHALADADPATHAPAGAAAPRASRWRYILGRREFWSLDLAVSPATLIPRPEFGDPDRGRARRLRPTARRPRRILDLGTGTGCLLLAALHEFPAAFGVGTGPLAGSRRLARRTTPPRSDWRTAPPSCAATGRPPLAARFDLSCAIRPISPPSDIDGLMPEVARHEPRRALDGGADGLAAYRRIVPTLAALLQPEGVAVLEVGDRAGSGTWRCLAADSGLAATTRRRSGGIARAVVLQSASGMKKAFGTGAAAG